MGNTYGYDGNNAPEYNVNGDAANGRQGSYSPGAITSRAGSGNNNNPYAAILDYARQPQARFGTPQGTWAPSQASSQLANGDSLAGTPFGGGAQPITGAPQPTLGGGPNLQKGSGDPAAQNNTNTPYDANGNYIGSGTDAFNTGTNTGTSASPPNGATDPNGDRSDPNVAAQYYQQWIPGITGQDVSNFRNWALGSNQPNYPIAQWYADGRPTLQQWQSSQQPTPSNGGTAGQPTFPGQNPNQFQMPGYPQAEDQSALYAKLQQLLNPAFQQGQQQLADRLGGQASLTGDSNSGAYGDVLGRQEGALINQQNSQVADMLNGDQQNSLNRALAQYQTNVGAATNVHGTDTGYTTGANSNATNRYLGDQQYNLGLGQLGLDRYKFDNPSINAILQAYLQMSPEQMAIGGISGIPWQNYVYTHP